MSELQAAVTKALKSARLLVAAGWHQGSVLPILRGGKTTHSVFSALMEGAGRDGQIFRMAKTRLELAIGTFGPVPMDGFADAPGRTVGDVLAALDRAIAGHEGAWWRRAGRLDR